MAPHDSGEISIGRLNLGYLAKSVGRNPTGVYRDRHGRFGTAKPKPEYVRAYGRAIWYPEPTEGRGSTIRRETRIEPNQDAADTIVYCAHLANVAS